MHSGRSICKLDFEFVVRYEMNADKKLKYASITKLLKPLSSVKEPFYIIAMP